MLQSNTQRYYSLDAIRGLAALVVLLNHFWIVITPDYPFLKPLQQWTPVQHAINGQFAVLLFFVLSGFVLTLPFLRKPQNYGVFMMKRLCRIYLPFVFGIIISFLLWSLFYDPSINLEWDEWSEPMNFSIFLSNLLMLGLEGTNSLNPPMWTLIIELRMAFLFPLLLLFVKYAKWAAIPISMVICLLIQKYYFSCCEGSSIYTASNVKGVFLLTFYFAQFFISGIFIAMYKDSMIKLMRKFSWQLHLLAVLAYVFLPNTITSTSFNLKILLSHFFAIYSILLALSFVKVDRFLNARPLLALGKYSYSLYLIHTPILFAFVYQIANPVMACLLSLPVIILATYLNYRFIEKPSAQLGYKIKSIFSKAKKPAAVS